MNNLNYIINNFILNKALFKMIIETNRELERIMFEEEEQIFERKMFEFNNDGE